MTKFEIVFWVNEKFAQLDINADYYREIKGRYQFIDNTTTPPPASNIALEIDKEEVLYIKQRKLDTIDVESSVEEHPQITKFNNRYARLLTV